MTYQNTTDHNFNSTHFGGADYSPERDLKRMSGAMSSVYSVMVKNPHQWRTLENLAELSDVPQSSVGSYLCYLRRDFGYDVPKRYIKNGLYEYCLGNKVNAGAQPKKRKKSTTGLEDTNERFRDAVMRAEAMMATTGYGKDMKPVYEILKGALHGH